MSTKKRTLNMIAAEGLATLLGSMVAFWIVMLLLAGWIGLQTILHGFDVYPFVFLLFLTNLVQFMSIFVLQNTQNRQTARLQIILKHVTRIVERVEHEEKELVQEERELVSEMQRGRASKADSIHLS